MERQSSQGYVLIAFVPAVVLGLACGKAIKENLLNANVVAIALIVGVAFTGCYAIFYAVRLVPCGVWLCYLGHRLY